jgi:hypothetical protein
VVPNLGFEPLGNAADLGQESEILLSKPILDSAVTLSQV